MRTFIALEIPELLRDELADVTRSLQASLRGRFVPRQNYHMTLAFLGDVPQAMLDDAQCAMECAATRVEYGRNIVLAADRLGSFGRAKNATLWMGFAKDPILMALAEDLRDRLDSCGFTLDGKSFLPHVTLARHACITEGSLPNLPFPEPTVATQITLFKSELTRDGAIYDPLYSVPLVERQ